MALSIGSIVLIEKNTPHAMFVGNIMIMLSGIALVIAILFIFIDPMSQWFSRTIRRFNAYDEL